MDVHHTATNSVKNDSTIPVCEESEKSILGHMLLVKDSVPSILSDLEKKHFYDRRNKEVFEAMGSLFSEGVSLDIVSLMGVLKEIKSDIPATYISELSSSGFISQKSVEYFVNRIISFWQRRELMVAAQRLAHSAITSDDTEFYVGEFQRDFYACLTGKKDSFESVGEISERVEENIMAMSRGEVKAGLSTGLKELDELMSLSETDLVILAARPAMGKSSLALNLAESVARQGKETLFFSLEMSKEQLTSRLIGSASSVPQAILKHGNITSRHDQELLSTGLSTIKNMGIYINDTPGMHVAKIRASSIVEANKRDLGLVVVDYIQLAKGEGGTRDQEIGSITRELKELAKELRVPVVALSQLNRSLESRPDKRPMMSDLRESGSIEQDADIIIFPYRDEVYNKDTPAIGLAEIIIGKNRHGRTGKAIVRFEGQYTRFVDC